MPISSSFSLFAPDSGKNVENKQRNIFPPPDRWHRLRIKELVDHKTQAGALCFIQTSEFLSFKTPLLVRTYYLVDADWSIRRLDNMFRNLGHKSRVDINGTEFNAKIQLKVYKSTKTGLMEKGIRLSWCPLWAEVENFEQELQNVPKDLRADRPLPSGTPNASESSEPLVEDEIPF